MGNLLAHHNDTADWEVEPTRRERVTREAAAFFFSDTHHRVSEQSLKDSKSVTNPLWMDDMQSKSTESTKGSPDLSVQPGRSYPDAKAPRRVSHTNSESAKSASSLASSFARAWFRRPKSDDHDLPPSVLMVHQRQRDHPNMQPTVPVKCPPPGRRSRQDQDEDQDHLQQVYDMRTWDMYLRITEARKKQQQRHSSSMPSLLSHATPAIATATPSDYGYFFQPEDAFLATTPLPHPPVESEHEMIFGDLE